MMTALPSVKKRKGVSPSAIRGLRPWSAVRATFGLRTWATETSALTLLDVEPFFPTCAIVWDRDVRWEHCYVKLQMIMPSGTRDIKIGTHVVSVYPGVDKVLTRCQTRLVAFRTTDRGTLVSKRRRLLPDGRRLVGVDDRGRPLSDDECYFESYQRWWDGAEKLLWDEDVEIWRQPSSFNVVDGVVKETRI